MLSECAIKLFSKFDAVAVGVAGFGSVLDTTRLCLEDIRLQTRRHSERKRGGDGESGHGDILRVL